MASPRVLVAGASGFTGALAARIVARHPGLELAAITSRSDAGKPLSALYPHHRVDLVLEELDLDRHAEAADAAIVAYPHGAAAETVRELRTRGLPVVDLSADFRLRDLATYERWYVEHPAPELLEGAVYGLPEAGHREALRETQLAAGPGCFPTAAILALGPVADRVTDVIVDAKTGVSGAGRAATQTTHFVSVAEDVKAYKVGAHRHTPEIEQELGQPVLFTPHLLPLDQGELVTAYARTDDPEALVQALREAYADEPFVEVVDAPPGVRDVRETNVCRLYAHAHPDHGRLQVHAAIDNLWKGSSSQAVQCLNLMLGLPEEQGLW